MIYKPAELGLSNFFVPPFHSDMFWQNSILKYLVQLKIILLFIHLYYCILGYCQTEQGDDGFTCSIINQIRDSHFMAMKLISSIGQ